MTFSADTTVISLDSYSGFVLGVVGLIIHWPSKWSWIKLEVTFNLNNLT